MGTDNFSAIGGYFSYLGCLGYFAALTATITSVALVVRAQESLRLAAMRAALLLRRAR